MYIVSKFSKTFTVSHRVRDPLQDPPAGGLSDAIVGIVSYLCCRSSAGRLCGRRCS